MFVRLAIRIDCNLFQKDEVFEVFAFSKPADFISPFKGKTGLSRANYQDEHRVDADYRFGVFVEVPGRTWLKNYYLDIYLAWNDYYSVESNLAEYMKVVVAADSK